MKISATPSLEFLMSQNLELKAKLAEAAALLRRLEWSYDNIYGESACPVCGSEKSDEPHEPDCELAKFLSENEGGK